MKVKIIINYNPFFTSSASANRWLTLIEGLKELDVDLKVIVVGSYQSKYEQQNFKKMSHYNGIEFKYITSKIVDSLWQRRYYKYIGKHFQFLKTKNNLHKELLNYEGIVWSENDLNLWKIITSIQNISFKLICEMSEFLDIHHFNKGNNLQKIAGNNKQKYFEKIYMKKLDGFVLMTKTLISHYSNFNNHPTLLHLPMTVDLERFQNLNKPPYEFRSPYIAFVGVMNDAKDGVNILIEAFYKISKNNLDINLYLVGAWNYDTPAHLERIKKLKLEERIKWVGERPRDVIPSIIENAELLVLPRPDSKQAQGGFPTKLGEYLATGRPVCATTVGELPNYLVDNESIFFAEPGSIDSFAHAMELALNNPKKANSIGQEGKKVAQKNFNKTIQSKKLYNFIKQL